MCNLVNPGTKDRLTLGSTPHDPTERSTASNLRSTESNLRSTESNLRSTESNLRSTESNLRSTEGFFYYKKLKITTH